jgi:hypothetical protein
VSDFQYQKDVMRSASQHSKPDISNRLIRLQLAGVYHFDHDESFIIKESAHHFLLIHRGTIIGMNRTTPVSAKACDLVYFHPSLMNSYDAPKGTGFQ